MLLFNLLHPSISLVTLRIIGAVAIVVFIVALGFVEFAPSAEKRRRVISLSPVFVVALIVLAYAILIAQGSIH
jgi:hypothetical protein